MTFIPLIRSRRIASDDRTVPPPSHATAYCRSQSAAGASLAPRRLCEGRSPAESVVYLIDRPDSEPSIIFAGWGDQPHGHGERRRDGPFSLPDDYWAPYAGTVRALTLDDVSAEADRILQPDRMIWVVVGDPARASRKASGRWASARWRFLDANGYLMEP